MGPLGHQTASRHDYRARNDLVLGHHVLREASAACSFDNKHVFLEHKHVSSWSAHVCAHVNTSVCTRGTRICVHVNTHTCACE